MVFCPKCTSEKCVKDGIINKRQGYRCKSCNFRDTVQHRGKSPDVKRQAFELYLEELGFRSIGRFLKCSHVEVYNWIKAFGEEVKQIRFNSVLEALRGFRPARKAYAIKGTGIYD